MSRRSPLNDRYKKDGAPKGVTRKSASSAKPKRDVSSGKTSSTAKRKTNSSAKYARLMPDTPEFKRLRKAWWVILGVAIVMLLVSLGITTKPVSAIIGVRPAQIASLALSWVALALVAYSWWIDLKKIRPMIKAHELARKVESKSGAKKS